MKRQLLVYIIVIGAVTGFAFTCVMLHLSAWWASPVVLPAISILILDHQASNGDGSAKIALRSAWKVTILAALFIWLPMIIMVIGNALFKRAPGRYTNWIAILVWPVGWAAFRFKQFNQKWYGMVEVVVGIVTAFATTTKGAFGPTQLLAIVGTIYVVSRGFSNIAEGRKKKEEIEKNVRAFREYLGRVKFAWSKLWAAIRNRDAPIRSR